MSFRPILLSAALTLLLAVGLPVNAQTAASTSAPPVPADIPTLAPVTVSGVVPGPGLWKVS